VRTGWVTATAPTSSRRHTASFRTDTTLAGDTADAEVRPWAATDQLTAHRDHGHVK
jgi:hypothetical protein